MSSSTFAGQITNDPVINAESKVGTVIAICVSFSVASAFFVALRLYTRVGLLRYAGNDDITIVVAEVLALLTALGAGMGEFLPFTYLPVFPGTLPSGGVNCLFDDNAGLDVDRIKQKRDMAWGGILGWYLQKMLCSNSRYGDTSYLRIPSKHLWQL